MLRDTHHGKPCKYCLRQMSSRDYALQPTRDHVVPICHGGREKVICCITCNGIKGSMLPEAWEAFMEANPRWWTLSKLELRRIHRAARGLPPRVSHARRLQRVLQGSPHLPVIVPRELIYGHREKGNTDRVAAVVEASPKVEKSVLETRTSRRSHGA